ncbi:MAG TPA: hypothetical protein PK199_04410 [Bacteroidales bacterium]|nr:hypothetical protein [Bacteroidales bacterium]
MRRNLELLLVVVSVICMFSCNHSDEKPAVNQQYDYLYYMSHDSVSQIWRFNALGRIDKTVYDTINDSVLITYVYNSNNTLNQKRYYFLQDSQRAYRSVDTVADEKIICSYTYQYNNEGYLIRLDYIGAQYADEFKTVATVIQGYTLYEVLNGNTTKITMHKSFSGTQTIVKDIVYENVFNELPNTHGIQQGSEHFLGKRNENLLHKIIYTYKENNILQESGVFDYTYTLDDSTQRISMQKELYTSDNDNNIPVNTLIYYEYR